MFNSFIRSIRLLSLLTLITGAACVPVVEAPSPAPKFRRHSMRRYCCSVISIDH